ncbi:hypothetical protein PO124_18070 [Bacillus licheniformis]|nr:hypothetical protein [Bacillus licheniformis]
MQRGIKHPAMLLHTIIALRFTSMISKPRRLTEDKYASANVRMIQGIYSVPIQLGSMLEFETRRRSEQELEVPFFSRLGKK